MVGQQQQQPASGSSDPYFTTGTYEVFDGTTDGEVPWVGEWDGTRLTGNLNPKQQVTVTVEDIRTMSQQPKMNKEGHELVYAPTVLNREQFHSSPTPEGRKLIETVYYNECARIIKERTGADKVIVFSFGFRVEPSDKVPDQTYAMVKQVNDVRGINNTAHVDRDPTTGQAQIREHDKDLFKKYKTVHVVNLWRPVGHIIERQPLLIIKTDNVPDFSYDNNFVYVEQRNVRGVGKPVQPMLKSHHPDFKHVFVNKLTPDECLIFRDTDLTGTLPGQPHSAFWDHNTRPDAPYRESIEVRALICYEKDWPAAVEDLS